MGWRARTASSGSVLAAGDAQRSRSDVSRRWYAGVVMLAFVAKAACRLEAPSAVLLAMAGCNVQPVCSLAGYFGLQLSLPPRSASAP
jgi:hypothetical protein